MKEYDKELLRSLVKQGLTNRKIAEKDGAHPDAGTV